MLDNLTPFKTERTWVRDKNGVHNWIVVVKATYEIAEDGTTTLSQEQVDPLYVPEYHGDDGESSLLYDADLVAMKPGTDVVVNATAYAPGGKPATKVPVMLKVGEITKRLMVYGDRVWRRTIIGRVAPSNPALFVSMPIIYERAFGGFDQTDPKPQNHQLDFRNPVGLGFCVRKANLIGKLVPNIQYPNQQFGNGSPAGFGAIASYWSPRKELSGLYDAKWVKERKPLLPTDYDPRSLLCSPVDQRPLGYLRGGEVVDLVNLTPGGALRFALPKVDLAFKTFFGSQTEQHNSDLVTVIIEPDHPQVIMVWQTSLEVRQDVDYLDKTIIYEKVNIQ